MNCVDCKNMRTRLTVDEGVIDYKSAVCFCQKDMIHGSDGKEKKWFVGSQFDIFGMIVGSEEWERKNCRHFYDMNDSEVEYGKKRT